VRWPWQFNAIDALAEQLGDSTSHDQLAKPASPAAAKPSRSSTITPRDEYDDHADEHGFVPLGRSEPHPTHAASSASNAAVVAKHTNNSQQHHHHHASAAPVLPQVRRPTLP